MPDHLTHRHPHGGRTSLYLVRHGRTPGNVARLLHGHTDAPLDELGADQAAMVADRLAVSAVADVLICSPLLRARSTANAIAERTGLTPVIMPGLMEMHFGDFEGVGWDYVLEHHPELANQFEDYNNEEAAWPGGESRRAFHRRVQETFGLILETYHDHEVIVVTHGGVLSSYLSHLHGLSPNDWRVFSMSNCSVTHVEITPEHTWVHALNDVAHLVEVMDVTERRSKE